MTYRAIMRVSKAWKASNEAETEVEKVYIRDEARELFRKNKNVSFLIAVSPMMLLIFGCFCIIADI